MECNFREPQTQVSFHSFKFISISFENIYSLYSYVLDFLFVDVFNLFEKLHEHFTAKPL